MKPNFALTLSFDGIGLLHRAFPGWHDVGEVTLDTPDLDTALAALRDKGLALSKGPLLSKLVIPDEQIKYLTFDSQGATGEALTQAVRDHLDGATPYALDELAYDWSLEAGQVHVAAVTRETLDEAETFADTHGFNPVSFVARPASGQFVGEPWFGEAAQAGRHLANGDSIERDTTPVRIVGPVPTPDTQDNAPAPSEGPKPKTPEADSTPEDAPDLTTQADLGDETAPDLSASDTAAPTAAFRSIRARRDDDDLPDVTPRLDGVARADPAKQPETSTARVTGHPKDVMSDAEVADLAESLTASLDADDNAPAEDVPAPDTTQSSTASSFFTRRDAKLSAPATTAPPPPQNEKQRMTVFGARDTGGVRGKPRYLGLMLTGLLLLFLLAVAAWASVFLDDGIARLFRGDDRREIAATPDFDAPQEDVAPAPPEVPLEQNDQPRDMDAPAKTPAQAPPPAPLTKDEALARYAATGIWQIAPDTPTAPDLLTLDDFYQTSIDPEVNPVDAVALPDIAKIIRDARPDTPRPPPAAGTQFQFDARGLVIATPDGALTPQGVPVYAGRPAVIPPDLPDRPEAIVSDLPTAEVLRLMEIRPRIRPDDLRERNERGQLGTGGRTQSELASLRPRLRPESAQEAAMAAAQAAATPDPESVAAALAEAVQTPDAFATATAQAVRASLKPNPRPRNFERVVARATQAARSAPVSPTQKVAPSAPTVTTVARAATEKNQISLRQVNLIGVYGSPSDRRALVRLANGRYKKVKVGDRLDGGQVAAIGDSELRYQKRGRNIVLRMPRG